MITKFLLFILICTNLMSIGLSVAMANFVGKHIAFDMDVIRSQHETQLRSYYTMGCLDGTDYPPEWRVATTGFNEHSTPKYCENMRLLKEPEIINSMVTLGKTTYSGE